ncbi:MAG: adenosine kinase [Acidimicrobiaceae bacterium]|nr:adenosine kinase [Acidimicrobiaceae bacterium]
MGVDEGRSIEVVALGSAIVDMFCQVPEGYVEQLGIQKGSMRLVGPEISDSVIKLLGKVEVRGGGSAANTLVGMANLGHKVTLIARTDLDTFGNQYVSDLVECGVDVVRPNIAHDLGTGRCLVMVTPDGERTMATWLGAASHLQLDDNSKAVIADSKLLYIEGYLYDLDSTKAQIHSAIDVAVKYNVQIALSLSDPFCVSRHRDEFQDLLDGPVAIVFANKEESRILTGLEDPEQIVTVLRRKSLSGAVTLGSSGAIVFDQSGSFHVPAQRVDPIIDTTGAGDLFAAGYLHGVLMGGDKRIQQCGMYGVACSAEVLSHFGARPNINLRHLIDDFS